MTIDDSIMRKRMSKVNIDLMDGNLPIKEIEIHSEESSDYDSWKDIMIMKLGSYTLEYDHYTKELTVTGGQLISLDAIDDNTVLKQIQWCRTLILRPAE